MQVVKNIIKTIKQFIEYTKKIKTKEKNRNLVLIFSFCFLMSFALIFAYNNYSSYISAKKNKSIDYRILIVDKTKNYKDGGKKVLSKLSTVQDVVESPLKKVVKTNLKNAIYGGNIILKAVPNQDLPTIIEGTSFSKINNYTLVCPITFYPDTKASTGNLEKNDLMNTEEVLSKNIEIPFHIDGEETTEKFRVAGTYDPKEKLDTYNTCYMKASLFKEYFEEENSLSYYVVVDSYENLAETEKNILAKGWAEENVKRYVEIDEVKVNMYNFLYPIILIFLGVIAVLYILNYAEKKIKLEEGQINIYLAEGNNINKISMFYMLEVLLNITKAFIRSIIIILIIYYFGKEEFMIKYINLGYTYDLYLGYLILIFVFTIILSCIYTYFRVFVYLKYRK